jgi:nucleotide-binding universal stress UspA family protein
MTTQIAPIVVGLDGSPGAAEALRWASWQSQVASAPVVAVYAYRVPEPTHLPTEMRQTVEADARARATRWFRDALAVSGSVPWHVRLDVVEGAPSDVLARYAADAAMLVLGSGDQSPTHAQDLTGVCRDAIVCPLVTVRSLVPSGSDLGSFEADRRRHRTLAAATA